MQLLKLLSYIFIYLVTCPTFANDKLKLSAVTAFWPNYTNKDRSGLYFDLVDLYLKKDDFSVTFAPWKRAQIDFQKGQIDFLIGESATANYCHFPKWPIDKDLYGAFYLKSKFKTILKPKDLKRLKIVWVRGYDINIAAPYLVNYEEVDDLPQGIAMVLKGRADVMIDYTSDIQDYISGQKLELSEYTVTQTEIQGNYIHLCFRKGAVGQQQALSFDQQMKVNFKSGHLKKLFEKYDRIKNFEILRPIYQRLAD